MYVGHIGVALGAKGWRRAIPLWALVFAAQGPDWIDTVLYARHMNNDRVELWSHSIPSVLVVALLVGAMAAVRWRSLATGLTLSATYALHLPADYLTGYKPLWLGGPHFGLQLYDQPRMDFVLEAVVIVIGWSLWRRTLPLRGRNRPAAWLLLAGLIAIQIGADLIFMARNGGLY
jgi:hypothetical protein